MGRVNRYPCPRQSECKLKYGIETIKGWKHHMTYAHKGYTVEELAAAEARGRGVTPGTDEEAFRRVGEGMPESVQELGGAAPAEGPKEARKVGLEGPAPAPAEEAERRRRLTREQRELNEKVNKFFTLLLDRAMGKITDEQRIEYETLRREMLVAACGVQLDLSESAFVLRSRLWLFLAILLTYVLPEGALGKITDAVRAKLKKEGKDVGPRDEKES
jgi:hypothetical protein